MPASGFFTSCATTAAIWPRRASAACCASCCSAALRAVMSARMAMYLIRLAVCIEEGNDRRVHPVVMSVLGPVAKLAVPDSPVGDRDPEVADEFWRVESGVDDPVVLSNELLAAVA